MEGPLAVEGPRASPQGGSFDQSVQPQQGADQEGDTTYPASSTQQEFQPLRENKSHIMYYKTFTENDMNALVESSITIRTPQTWKESSLQKHYHGTTGSDAVRISVKTSFVMNLTVHITYIYHMTMYLNRPEK